MDLMLIGSANQYAKSMAKRTLWDLKKRSGDLTAHKSSLSDYVNFTKASSVLPRTDEQDAKLSSIMTKAQTGKKLSYDDWEYLRSKKPALYAQLQQAERERENYEKALRRCKTKEEAQRLHVSKLGEIMEAAKNGDQGAIYRLNRLTRTMVEFTESEEYKELPTEAEEAIERESERQERREALREEMEAEKARRDEESGEAERDAQIRDAETAVKPDAESGVKSGAETAVKSDAQAVSDTPKRTDTRQAGRTVAGPEKRTDTRRTESASQDAPTHDAASVAPFGRQAYLNQRESESRARRKAFNAKA